MTSTVCIQGQITVPGDKSVSHRALMLSGITNATSRISGLANNQDVLATRHCLEALGVAIQRDSSDLIVSGSPYWQAPKQTLNAANSGTTIRLLSGLLAAQHFKTTITGDASLCKRPMGRIIEPLSQMGANLESTEGHAPLSIHPTDQINGITYTLPHASAQVKSAILLAGLYAQNKTRVIEPVKSRDHTERMLRFAGVDLQQNGNEILLAGGQVEKLQATHWQVPGDVSSAAFWIVAALLIPGSKLRIQNILLNPARTGIISVLQSVGGTTGIENQREACGESVGDLLVQASQLKGDINLRAEDIPALVDELPILAVASVFLNGTLTVHGAEELRVKESDRISALASEFGKLGITVNTFADGFSIAGQADRTLTTPTTLLNAHHDHRIAMSLRILNTIANTLTRSASRWDIMDEACIAVSYPDFEATLTQLLSE